jgi:hypothetical protein
VVAAAVADLAVASVIAKVEEAADIRVSGASRGGKKST